MHNRIRSFVCGFDASFDLRLVLGILTGLILGTAGASFAGPSFSSRMLPALSGRMSIVMYALRVILPFLLCVLAVHIHNPRLSVFVCSCKLFCFSFCGRLVHFAYGGAGWLLRGLLLFSDIITVPVLCFYCMLARAPRRGTEKRLIVVCAAVFLLTAAIDHYVVSPFLAERIDI